jgi:peptidoglycan/LPS O-acetylase OafA/YrhL
MSRDLSNIPALDGLRGVAILLVMLHHFAFYGGLQRGTGVENVIHVVTMAGWVGVDLFFVLSGFLITRVLFDSKGSPFFFRHFYIRRCLRIFPLYYGVLVFSFLVLPMFREPGRSHLILLADQSWYWTYLINVRIAIQGWPEFGALAHFWSLAVEEQFYLLWPVVVFVLPSRRLWFACAACVGAAFGLRLGLGWVGEGLAAYVSTLARMDSLAIGALVALAARHPGGLQEWQRLAKLVAVGAGTFLFLEALVRGGLRTEDFAVHTIGYTGIAVFFGAVLVLAVTSSDDNWIGRVLSLRTLRLAGRYSYGLYVFHHPIVLLLRRQLTIPDIQVLGSQLPGFLAYSVLAGGMSLALAVLSWHLYESRFLALKGRFPYVTAEPRKAALEV